LGRLRGLLATMRRTAFFFGFVAPWLWAGALHAQSPSTNACAQIESELVIQRARAEQLEQTLGSLEGTIAELRAAEARLGQAVAAAEQCRAERQEFCTATQNFAKGLAQGRLDIRELSRCIGPEPRRALVDQLSGWRNATSALTELGNYAAGVTDRPPHLAAPHGTPIEAVVSDLLAESGKGGTPRVYRRLLVEAMTLVAPRAWERLRERGPDELEAWFASTEPLEPELFEEAQRGAEGQAEGGALSAARSLVHVSPRAAAGHARVCARRTARARARIERTAALAPPHAGHLVDGLQRPRSGGPARLDPRPPGDGGRFADDRTRPHHRARGDLRKALHLLPARPRSGRLVRGVAQPTMAARRAVERPRARVARRPPDAHARCRRAPLRRSRARAAAARGAQHVRVAGGHARHARHVDVAARDHVPRRPRARGSHLCSVRACPVGGTRRHDPADLRQRAGDRGRARADSHGPTDGDRRPSPALRPACGPRRGL